ncbi:protein phosphatase, putative [Plasmodium gallinaceum]|uniref:Protein phosphatase, putative n=1 Tax=Plasmodium gallinaceum TaxID=5849 RepID=A0A1J1GUY0_PLAGA|nr:protein phosphatase, putative [Plasmodium gallinaceum]CRG96319.1 protein phosphatase, putative [Plasmodium gallinaceum]
MWSPLNDSEYTETSNKYTKKGFFHTLKKYKKFIYIFLGIFVIYILFIVYYEINEKNADKDIDCNVLNEECKNYTYPEFDPERLLIVDANIENNNFLLRSSVPIFNGIFSEELLLKEIKRVVEESNLVYKNNYSLYIISLLKNNQKEGCCYASEKCYVKEANVDNQLILGYRDKDPYDLKKEELMTKLKNLTWNTDDILNKIDSLYEKFLNMKNTIFVIHCRRGRDRTGEYVGAYRMIKKKQSFDSVMNANSEIGILRESFVKMQKWICLYLENVLNYPNMGCYDYRSGRE